MHTVGYDADATEYMEEEGDVDRCLTNWKLLMLYFRSRSRGMKYAFEAMCLLTCVKHVTCYLPCFLSKWHIELSTVNS